MHRDPQFLLDILQSAELILSYTALRTKDEFMTDIQLQDSIIRRLTVIAEAAKRISEETRNSLTGIPWTAINGMRNRLVHEYDDVDLDILWNVIQIEIPSLVIALKPHVSPSP